MLIQSSNSAGARFLDGTAVVESLRRTARQLVRENADVAAILLFGSLARGDYTCRSDADLLVCLRFADAVKPADRIPRFLVAFLDAPVPVDILPLTEDEIRRRFADAGHFWKRICGEAILLAGDLPECLDGARNPRGCSPLSSGS